MNVFFSGKGLTMLSFRFLFVLFSLITASFAPAQQPSNDTHPASLGQIVFPNSCAPAAQKPFLKGVALLHSFQYAASEKSFADTTQADPQCAIAYWGLAMTHYHPLWEGAGAKALVAGRAELQKIKAEWPASKRERGYIDAAGIIFGDNRRLGKEQIEAYSRAMDGLYKQYPDDGEAAAFYALSLLALPGGGDNARKEAISILNRLTAAQPEHPGAVHYLIHAADTPELAPQGLEAARRYARVAPDSSHALHMPSHIFVRLGLWQESIDSNQAAAVAAADATQQHLGEAHYQFHAMDYLDYSYLQRGEEAKARQIVEDIDKVPGRTDHEAENMRTNFIARNLLELHHWKEAMALTPAGNAYNQQKIYAVRAIAAARTGDKKAAEENFKSMKKAAKSIRNKDEHLQAYPEEAQAWIAFAKGKSAKALKQMRALADQQDREDSEGFTVPAREMLADMLLELHQPAKALAEYEASLKLAPNRFNGLYGAALAAKMAGDTNKANGYYSKLHESCAPQADREELQHAGVVAAGDQ